MAIVNASGGDADGARRRVQASVEALKRFSEAFAVLEVAEPEDVVTEEEPGRKRNDPWLGSEGRHLVWHRCHSALALRQHEAPSAAGQPASSEPERVKSAKAAIRKSVSPDCLTSLIDGRKYKSLKRHLTAHGMTPHDYSTA